jgi:hypothetical protein
VCYDFGRGQAPPTLVHLVSEVVVVVTSSMDSGLEAFSHSPTDDSFAALPVQATAMAKYLDQRFLSY